MNHIVTAVFIITLSLHSMEALSSEASPYAGEQVRDIKALSDSHIAGLLSGKGLGYAKAAELNGYPGPAHVLELSKKLSLTAEQRSKTKAIFDRMEAHAKELGARLVAAERALDHAFRDRKINESSLSELVSKIGNIEARLREVHLKAHLEQTRLLNERQLEKYMTLRGYGHDGHGKHHGHQHDS